MTKNESANDLNCKLVEIMGGSNPIDREEIVR